ncbi:MAG: FAD-binding protein [Phycisphaeraceae bacterium]|nr:FAD-binding protein [Phycisphaeraceae bacterium]
MADTPRVIIVGGGLAGLAAAVRVAEAGVAVDLFSMVPVKRSHSVCAQGGINACTEPVRQEGFSEWDHFDETLLGGDFINHQPPVYEMTHAAPKIIDLLDRMGVPFNRTPEGFLARRYFGGSVFRRTHYTGASTGQQLLYGLDEQVRRRESEGLVNKYEFSEFLWPIVDDDEICRGIVAQDMRTMEIKAYKGDAVVMATGGCGLIYGKSTMSVICTGGAASRCYQAGAWLGNPEMIQVHPTAIPGEDKCRLMSESARGEGGRVWLPGIKQEDGTWKPHADAGKHPNDIPEDERYYVLEEMYPDYGPTRRHGNLVSRDVATRGIFFAVQQGFGVGGGRMAYLDITHLPADTKEKLAAILEIYEKFTGDDPRDVPMKIFPAVHYSMGGMYTVYETQQEPKPKFLCDILPEDAGELKDPSKPAHPGMVNGSHYNMMTNVKGLYAFGEVNYQYHGATRLGANALLSCIFDGIFCGLGVARYAQEQAKENPISEISDEVFDKYVKQEEAKSEKFIATVSAEGEGANPYDIHRRLGEVMTDEMTVVRTQEGMQKALGVVRDLIKEYEGVKLGDDGAWTNQNLSFTRALGDMLIYAEAMLLAGIERKESRGCHYCSDNNDRDDKNFQKSAVCQYDAKTGKHKVVWEDVPAPLVEPRVRDYSGKSKKKKKAAAKA